MRIFACNVPPWRTSFNSVIMFIAVRRSMQIVEGEVERVEIAPAMRRGQGAGGAVGDQRNLLLRESAMRPERRIEAGQVVPVGAGPDDGEPLGEDNEVADTIG